MEGLIEKIILAGFGVLSVTKENAAKIVEELVKKGTIAKEEQPDLARELLEKGNAIRKEIEDIIEKSITDILDKMNIPTKSDINIIIKRIEKIDKKIEKGK